MAHKNNFITFLRHYGPIAASDNMYDELIKTEIDRLGITPVIEIEPTYLEEVRKNFESPNPKNVILTGTAGDGKTYQCRRIWEQLDGSDEEWKLGKKKVTLPLSASGKTVTIVKDLSELTQKEKNKTIEELANAVNDKSKNNVFLVAANDGQLLSSWRDWSVLNGESTHKIVFGLIEDMLVEERKSDDQLNLRLYNLSRLDASETFKGLMEQIVEHEQWSQCKGCNLHKDNGTSPCPIRINRNRLRNRQNGSTFLTRLVELIKLSNANGAHLPIRDLLLLCVNIILGDQSENQTLLTCQTARNRVRNKAYELTNPYANVFGANLRERIRQQYHVFAVFEAFGIGRETSNKFDNLLIYGKYDGSSDYDELVSRDVYYGGKSYESYLTDYLEQEREQISLFMRALIRQRQRLFFELPASQKYDPWQLTVYQSSGRYLKFTSTLRSQNDDASTISEQLIRGLNRTFCGMMIDEGTELYLASSGGDGRNRIALLLNRKLPTTADDRMPFCKFTFSDDEDQKLCLRVIDPIKDQGSTVDELNLQLTHFEYLTRVANGSLPAIFSRQCNEDFLDFKLRLIERLNQTFKQSGSSANELAISVLSVSEGGRVQNDVIKIRLDK